MKIPSRLKSNLNPPPFFSIRVKSTGSMFGLVETSLREYVIRRLLDPFQSRKYRASIQIRVFKQRVLEPRLRSSPLANLAKVPAHRRLSRRRRGRRRRRERKVFNLRSKRARREKMRGATLLARSTTIHRPQGK